MKNRSMRHTQIVDFKSDEWNQSFWERIDKGQGVPKTGTRGVGVSHDWKGS